MSSTASPAGLKPIRHVNGKFVPAPRAILNGVASGYSADIYFQAPVTMSSNGTLIAATTAQDIYGVFAGVQYIANNTALMTPVSQFVSGTTYTAGTMYAYVWDDPYIIYEMQANGSLAATSVGDQADFVNPGSGSNGYSTTALSSSLAGAGSSGQMRILGLSTRIDNAWGDSFTVVETQIARQQYTANKNAI